MKIKWCVGFVGVLLGIVLGTAAFAAWPQLEKRLDTWDGAREVHLPADTDPVADPVFAPLVGMLLEKGYAVHTRPAQDIQKGLILARHEGPDGERLLLTRARDGALLALEPLESSASDVASRNQDMAPQKDAQADEREKNTSKSTAARVLSTSQSSERRTGQVQSLHIESDAQERTMRVGANTGVTGADALLSDIPGTPRSIASWAEPEASAHSFHLFALYDTRLVHFIWRSGNLEQMSEFTPPGRVSRALRLECSDLDEDGNPELAPVWVEDIYSVDEGTESRLHSWIVEVDAEGEMVAGSADLEGYLALMDEKLYLQERGEYRTFESNLYALEFADGEYRRSSAPVTRARHWIFNHARWPDRERVLIWNDDERLVLAARSGTDSENSYRSTGTLLSDFGTYAGVSIYVPMEEPEYRSGFSAHDKVMARKVQVPRRMHACDDTLFTLARGRGAGVPLVGRPSGRDRLVQIDLDSSGLQARFPFATVDAFILDFDILERANGTRQGVLLLNEEADGNGRAYVQVQSGR
ncbi:MAG: hypothetical protein ACOC0G_01260 [Thermodesulfobacteriota bacterium]